MSKHLADKRQASSGARQREFFKLARGGRGPWHRSHSAGGAARLKQFLRIEKGQQA